MTNTVSAPRNDQARKLKQAPPHQKRRPNSKHLKFVSSTCNKSVEGTFQKMDSKNEEHARRMQQRRRMISYGKNTVGYDEYLRQVPKDKRRPRCMDTPATPDYSLDIPNKRWTGQIRAWRRALHKYDPPDLQTSFSDATMEEDHNPTVSTEAKGLVTLLSVKDRELAKAKSMGLQVQFEDSASPTSVLQSNEMSELDRWDGKRKDDDAFFSDNDDADDSDDDLL